MLMKSDESFYDLTGPLLDLCWPHAVRPHAPTAVHAGHFMLLPTDGACLPSVSMSNCCLDPTTSSHGDPIRESLNRFALESWRIGSAFARKLKEEGRSTGLTTLVNDWQFLRQRKASEVAALRSAFYSSNRQLFLSYRSILSELGLSDNDILAVGPWSPFVSEYWLRRRIERRLKRIVKNGSHASRLTVEKCLDGPSCIVFDDFGRDCRLLVCGQADCAGEVMELVCMLYEMGFRQIVNVIPAECEIPVNEGTRRAISVFGLADFTALNISLPCLGAPRLDSHGMPRVAVNRVRGERADGMVDAFVEPLRSAT